MSEPDKQPPDPAVAQEERRAHPRHGAQVQLELRQEGSDVPMRLATTDLSQNGCYVEMIAPLSVGVRVRATLWLGEERVVVRGCVVTRHPQFGNGIMFLVFEDNGQQILRTFLAQLRTDN